MLALATKYGNGPVLLKAIAKEEDISEKYLGQIILSLKSYDLVKSFRGARGGYSLSRQPSEISLKEIVEVLEGDLSLVECVKTADSCKRMPRCVTQEIWCKLSSTISSTLESFTLLDMVIMYQKKQQPVAEHMYFI